MALIIVPIWNTIENDRFEYSRQTILSLLDTVDFSKHRLFLSDNGSIDSNTELMYSRLERDWTEDSSHLTIKRNGKNLGTARAINEGLKTRLPNEHCIKVDSDVTFQYNNWVDELEEAIARQPKIGICALKRFDLDENPYHELEHYRSELYMLPHEKGQRWIVVELVRNVMGTCTMFNHELLDKIGYMWQVGPYGLDDHDISVRSTLAGFMNCFLTHIPITHIDTGENKEYAQWKVEQAGLGWPKMQEIGRSYIDGTLPIYYDGGWNEQR